MAINKSVSSPVESRLDTESERQQPLQRINFILMAVAAVMIVLGFILMTGAPATAEEFNPDIFSTRRIVVGPTIAFLGFVFMGVAIAWNPKSKKDNN
ncbi:MAG: DUF3098 domain-containing protein [Paramuribaculum sp.]|nr:DUF3098 domain-containing protein [Paramuribaculum sp.]